MVRALVGSNITRLTFDLTGISELDLSKLGLTSKELKAIIPNLDSRNLRTLNLSGNYLDDDGTIVLAEKLDALFINELILDGNGVTDLGAKELATKLHKSSLEKLFLSRNCIGEIGAEALLRALPNTRLIDLDLTHNNIQSFDFVKLSERQVKTIVPSLLLNPTTALDLNGHRMDNTLLNILIDYLPKSLLTNLSLKICN